MFKRKRYEQYSAPTPDETSPVASQEAVDVRDDEILKAIQADPILDGIPEAERKEAVSQTLELYLAAKANVAPVITGFTDNLLQSAEGRQIIFAARDGLGPYEVAKILLQRFGESYAATEDDLVFAYLTRKVVGRSDPEDLAIYLEQTGVHDLQKPVVIADIGMYGTIMHSLREILPEAEARYLISKNQSIDGYADNGATRTMHSVDAVIGNPAIHFMEDTFSGLTTSPDDLENRNGVLTPNYIENGFEPKELLKRKYAMQAIKDHAVSIDYLPTAQEQQAAIDTLDEFLGDPEEYRHLMVPHIQ